MTVQVLHPIPDETVEILSERLYETMFPYHWEKLSSTSRLKYNEIIKTILEGYKVEKHD